MKIELVLSGTYLHIGKVYQKVNAQGKRVTYTVSEAVGNHLIAQRNERDIPYFRMVADSTPASIPAAKRHEKGGNIVPEPEAVAKTAEESAAVAAPVAAAEPVVESEDDDIDIDDVSDEEIAESVTL